MSINNYWKVPLTLFVWIGNRKNAQWQPAMDKLIKHPIKKAYCFLKPIYLFLKADCAFCTDQKYKADNTRIQLNMMKLHVQSITSS